MAKFIDRTNEQNYNTQGYFMIISKYINNKECYVKFTEPRVTIVRCYYSAFKSGKVKNPYHNSMFNVACVGETNVNNNDGSRKKSYYYWKNMISRCYKSDINVNPTYVECMVCNEWLCYANFEKWFDKNYYTIPNEKICLDKDILVKGNKIYSPQTCCFVPQKINNMFENNEKETKGIQYYKNAYVVNFGNQYIGRYKTFKDAKQAYYKAKKDRLERLANRYKDYINIKVYNKLIGW